MPNSRNTAVPVNVPTGAPTTTFLNTQAPTPLADSVYWPDQGTTHAPFALNNSPMHYTMHTVSAITDAPPWKQGLTFIGLVILGLAIGCVLILLKELIRYCCISRPQNNNDTLDYTSDLLKIAKAIKVDTRIEERLNPSSGTPPFNEIELFSLGQICIKLKLICPGTQDIFRTPITATIQGNSHSQTYERAIVIGQLERGISVDPNTGGQWTALALNENFIKQILTLIDRFECAEDKEAFKDEILRRNTEEFMTELNQENFPTLARERILLNTITITDPHTATIRQMIGNSEAQDSVFIPIDETFEDIDLSDLTLPAYANSYFQTPS